MISAVEQCAQLLCKNNFQGLLGHLYYKTLPEASFVALQLWQGRDVALCEFKGWAESLHKESLIHVVLFYFGIFILCIERNW